MNKMALVVSMLGISATAGAANVGLGVSLRQDDATIYVPIDVSKTFRIEPLLSYEQQEFEYEVAPNTGYTAIQERTSIRIGTGLFGVASVGDSAAMYYGGRIAYLSRKTKLSYSGTLPSSFVPQPGSEQDQDGFSLAPTLGLEYRIGEHFSVAGEAMLTHSRIDGDGEEESNTVTSTNVVFRYRF